MQPSYEHQYPPGEWSKAGVRAALAGTPERFPLPNYGEADFWREVEETSSFGPLIERIYDRAETAEATGVVPLHASGYLEYYRHGTRTGYPVTERRRNLAALAIATCLDRTDRFHDPLWDHLWALCEQTVWTQPAHLVGDESAANQGLPRPVEPENRIVALGTATMAKELAEIESVLGEVIHPAVRERIHHEIDRRVLTPFLVRDDIHWLEPPTNNWNAVCNAGVLVAALHTCRDTNRLARIVAKVARSLGHYLGGFDAGGCTAEGVGYWRYGFGAYVHAAKHLEVRTDGELSLFSPPLLERIAAFPVDVELSPGRYPPFSDAEPTYRLPPHLCYELGERYDIQTLIERGNRSLAAGGADVSFEGNVRDLAWTHLERTATPRDPERTTYFAGCDWWIARGMPNQPAGIVVAAKGGHNGESHNHNDCGSFVCQFQEELLVTDPGSGPYEDRYFSPDRYEYLSTRSAGHSVPQLNGHEQSPGETNAATVVDCEQRGDVDRLLLDLAECYPHEAGVETLRRSIVLDRSGGEHGRVHLEDEITFAPNAPGTSATSQIVSFLPMTSTDTSVVITGEQGRVVITPESVDRVVLAEQTTDHWENSLRQAQFEQSAGDPPATLTLSLELEPTTVEQ